MLRIPIGGLALCLVAISAAAPAGAADPEQLFDGRTLSGWHGDTDHWRVENGAIVGEIPPGERLNRNTWLVWDGELKNFDLRLQFKLSGAPAANSGIQFRCQVTDHNHVSGYQADLDMGATWLGRIYDEHGRALLVERGSRVSIAPDGERSVETFAPAAQYGVLFRENDWNDYRIVAINDHVAVYINGTLFSELRDRQEGEHDLSGGLALQLHSGPETRVEFRNIDLEVLDADDDRIRPFQIDRSNDPGGQPVGSTPTNAEGESLNLGFENGDLSNWASTGNAFQGQPVDQNGIASRWPGQSSAKVGRYFIGGYERVKDGGVGTLTSEPFAVSHPYASFLIGGGDSDATRVEILKIDPETKAEIEIFRAVGNRREQMRRVAVDLQRHRDQLISVRLVDESGGGWGHLNFDDFRFHQELPSFAEAKAEWRSTQGPLLQHLRATPVSPVDAVSSAASTIEQMFVPPGFAVELIAAEPQVHQPMAFTFDGRGRLWVAEGYCYPKKRAEGEGLDRILIFTDSDGDGAFDQQKVFAEGLNLVSGMEVGLGGVWIGAAPELLFIPDRDGDDLPDGPPQVLLDGFGFADTHETLNSFHWGPDGWLYGNQGVFNSSEVGKPGSNASDRVAINAGVWRYHPTRHQFKVFAHGGSNQWGLDHDLHGQLFMTHCRSHWGRGATTHVMQGGHYWNQVNAGYAPFVSAAPSLDQPGMRNFLLASARYGHGEGGAGKPGSRAVYGGHSHVGTMIYLGDNWPPEYRNHLLTHNLHGHQINHQDNQRHLGGYRTFHAGSDPFFCSDRQYIGVDLKVGPDGAVYFSDWYDPRHCHNPNVEQWDRGNGRIYRMKYAEGFHPEIVDFANASEKELVEAQLLTNDWHVRQARLEIQRRCQAGALKPSTVEELRSLAKANPRADRRLRAIWALHAANSIRLEDVFAQLLDEDEFVRAWTVQLAVESLASHELAEALVQLARRDSSLLVQRYLASAIPRLSVEDGWQLAVELAKRSESTRDKELTQLLWFNVASLAREDMRRLVNLHEQAASPLLKDFILWYAAKQSDEGTSQLVAMIKQSTGDERKRLLGLLELASRGKRGIVAPPTWSEISRDLYQSQDAGVRQASENIGAVFGDRVLFANMRRVLADPASDVARKRYAVSILRNDGDRENLPILLPLLDDDAMVLSVLPVLGNYQDLQIASALIRNLNDWSEPVQRSALALLTARADWATQLIDSISDGETPREILTAFEARQISNLGDKELKDRLTGIWGRLGSSTLERQTEIHELVDAYNTAPLWAYNAGQGAAHFKKLCANCHQPNTEAETRLAPKLAGSGSKGIGYLVENILDPNAVIGRDFQARNVLTVDGRVITGLVVQENDSAITVRTTTGTTTISRDDVDSIRISKNSFMPEDLLQTLNDRERLELLKYLMSL